ncbi:MAG: YkgJ family cysteine cluster protein [Flavobacteriales bacterium]|nr:YkgJ family cysteine cluster protein [Flavobacteriales bacterium]
MEFSENIRQKGKSKKKVNKRLAQKLGSLKEGELDRLFHNAHEEVFEYTDCLTCGNCCKTTSPVFTYNDIERISKSLRLKPGKFIDTYLHLDDENDYVLNSAPCPFIDKENYCSIYSVRPKACSDYPHTDRRKQFQLLDLNLRNTEVCPAIFDMFEKIRKEI